MPTPVLFRDRSRGAQIVLAGVVPAVVGALAGIVLGISSGAYWTISILAAVGGFLAGFEHLDGWGGADRGLVSGAIYGTTLLSAAGGRLARMQRERASVTASPASARPPARG